MIYYAITPNFTEQIGENRGSYPTATRYVSESEKHYRVYELLKELDLTDEQEAIKASSWCELAEIGEIYENENFTIEVIEE